MIEVAPVVQGGEDRLGEAALAAFVEAGHHGFGRNAVSIVSQAEFQDVQRTLVQLLGFLCRRIARRDAGKFVPEVLQHFVGDGVFENGGHEIDQILRIFFNELRIIAKQIECELPVQLKLAQRICEFLVELQVAVDADIDGGYAGEADEEHPVLSQVHAAGKLPELSGIPRISGVPELNFRHFFLVVLNQLPDRADPRSDRVGRLSGKTDFRNDLLFGDRKVFGRQICGHAVQKFLADGLAQQGTAEPQKVPHLPADPEEFVIQLDPVHGHFAPLFWGIGNDPVRGVHDAA